MTRETPYAPMHPPAKHVTFEQMQQILRKHNPNQAGSPLSEHKPAEAGPQRPNIPAKPELKWRQLSGNSWESSKGPVILKAEDQYIVFDRKSGDGHIAQVIGRFKDGKTAKDFVRLLA